MSENEALIPKHGGFRRLKSFQVAQLVYDVTVRFCGRYIDARSRTRDQMVQAARSGVQNIAEGSQASGTSKKTELKLTNVARASLEELRLDYEDFLRQRGLAQWPRADPRRQALIDRRPATADEVAAWARAVHDGGGGRGGRTKTGGAGELRGDCGEWGADAVGRGDRPARPATGGAGRRVRTGRGLYRAALPRAQRSPEEGPVTAFAESVVAEPAPGPDPGCVRLPAFPQPEPLLHRLRGRGRRRAATGGAALRGLGVRRSLMALVRCQKHGNPQGRTNRYVTYVRPLGYPETAALCGRRGCAEPGLVWLTVEEEFAYLKGERIFDLPVAAIRVRVEGEDQ